MLTMKQCLISQLDVAVMEMDIGIMKMDIGPAETITDEMIDALFQSSTVNQTNSPFTGSIPAKNSVISEVEVVDQSNLLVTKMSPLLVILPAILSL